MNSFWNTRRKIANHLTQIRNHFLANLIKLNFQLHQCLKVLRVNLKQACFKIILSSLEIYIWYLEHG